MDIVIYPKPLGNGPMEIFSYDEKIPAEGGNMLALWGQQSGVLKELAALVEKYV